MLQVLFLVDANVSTMFGPGTGGIYGTSVQCAGTEDRFTSCTFSRDVSSCTHVNDAGVTCGLICKHRGLLSFVAIATRLLVILQISHHFELYASTVHVSFMILYNNFIQRISYVGLKATLKFAVLK